MFGEQDVDGDYPSTGVWYPRNLGATFDQGAVDEFQVKTSFLGTIKRMNIGSFTHLFFQFSGKG